MGFGEEDHRGKSPSSLRYIQSRYRQHDWVLMLTLITQLRQPLLGLSTLKLFFLFPFLYCTLWKEAGMCRPHIRDGKWWSTSLRHEYGLCDFAGANCQYFGWYCIQQPLWMLLVLLCFPFLGFVLEIIRSSNYNDNAFPLSLYLIKTLLCWKKAFRTILVSLH